MTPPETSDSRGRSASEIVTVMVPVLLWPEEWAAVEEEASNAHVTGADLLAGAAMRRARQLAGTDEMGRPG